mmetsp:Transcript_21347/g.30525  ORF Transcript_21347/g.30525 Transcript_21347/m.30525 type:complete len:308 (-) Transcript_21347:162-1085(-)
MVPQRSTGRYSRSLCLTPIAEEYNTTGILPTQHPFDDRQASDISQLSSTSSDLQWRIPPFPLHAIGGITSSQTSQPQLQLPVDISSLGSTSHHITSSGFLVLREYRRDSISEIFRLGQDSQSGTLSTWETHTAMRLQLNASYESAQEAAFVNQLVQRAVQWLLNITSRDMDSMGLTTSIYWAIRSLPSFYAPLLARAAQQGETPLRAVDDGEWPDEPSGEDSWDLSAIPEWLRYILVVDDLHDYGLAGISSRRVQDGRRSRRRWFPPAQLYIETIPERELDDPPDSWDSEHSYSGIIEELSRTDISE